MNLDEDNNEIQSEDPFIAFSKDELFYKLKYSNLPVKLKIILIKKLDEVTVSQEEIDSFNDEASKLRLDIIQDLDYDSIKNPPLIYENLGYNFSNIIWRRFSIEQDKDFFNFKGMKYKPFNSENIRDMLYKVAIRHMSEHNLTKQELRFVAEESVSLEQLQKDNPFVVNVWQQTLLHIAVINNNIQEVKNILSKDKNMLELKDRWGSTALHYAVELALLDLTKYLVEEGADILERNNDGDTLLHLATIEDNEDMISYVLEKGLDINVRDNKLQTPLHWTIIMERKETMNYLIERGADINVQDERKKTPLHIAYDIAYGHKIMSELRKEGVDRYKKYDTAIYLVEKGADVNARNDTLQTPLYWTVDIGNKEQLEYLVEKGAHINIQDINKRTPLHIACLIGDKVIDIINYLIEEGVDINAQDKEGKTALHLASSNKYVSIIEILLEKGANPNVIDKKGKKAIHYVYCYKPEHYKIIHDLIDHGTYLNEDKKYRKQNKELIYKIILPGSITLFKKLLETGVNIDDYFSLKNYKVMLIDKEIKDKEIESYIWNRMKEVEEREKYNKENEKGTHVDKGLVVAARFLEYLLERTDRKENMWYVYLVNIVRDINEVIVKDTSQVIIKLPTRLYRDERYARTQWIEAYDKLAIKSEKLSSEEMFEVMIEFIKGYDSEFDIEDLIELLEDISQSRGKYKELWDKWGHCIKRAEEYKYEEIKKNR